MPHGRLRRRAAALCSNVIHGQRHGGYPVRGLLVAAGPERSNTLVEAGFTRPRAPGQRRRGAGENERGGDGAGCRPLLRLLNARGQESALLCILSRNFCSPGVLVCWKPPTGAISTFCPGDDEYYY